MTKYSKIYEPRGAILTQTITVDQAGLELKAILLPQLLESYDHRCEPPCLIKHRGKIKFICRQCSLCTRRNQALSQWKPDVWKPVQGSVATLPVSEPHHAPVTYPRSKPSCLTEFSQLNTLLSSSCRRSAPTNFSDSLFPSEIFPYFLHDVTCYDYQMPPTGTCVTG